MECPNCHVEIEDGSTSCYCGWKLAVQESPRGQCTYTTDGHRCQLPGDMNAGSHKNPDWHCLWHYHLHILTARGSFSKFSQWMDGHGYRGDKVRIWKKMTGKQPTED